MSEFAYRGKCEMRKSGRKRGNDRIVMGCRVEVVSYLTCMADLEGLSVRGYERMNGVANQRINETTKQRVNEGRRQRINEGTRQRINVSTKGMANR